jgi:hypothetical protein
VGEFYEAGGSAKEAHIYFDETGMRRRKLYGGGFTGGDESSSMNISTTESPEQ